MEYVTLYQLRAELGLGAGDTGDDALLRRHLKAGSRWIDRWCGRRFDVRRETRRQSGGYAALLLDGDLLDALALTNGDNSAIDLATLLYEPPNAYPRYAILTTDGYSPWTPTAAGTYRQAVAVDGLWGYHPDYANAWADTLDTVADDPLAVNATAIAVADPLAAPEDSDDPRFQVGNLIRLSGLDGDNLPVFEFCLVRALTESEPAIEADPLADPPVEAVDAVPATIIVQRAVNGTSAREWPQGTVIHVFRPWENVQRALMRLATWSYRLKDVTFYERITVLGNTQKVAPGGIPDDVVELLPGRLVVR